MTPITKNLLSFLVITLNLIFFAESKEKLTWYKGNTHTHSLWSDGNDFPEMIAKYYNCLLYTSPSPRDGLLSRMPSSA